MFMLYFLYILYLINVRFINHTIIGLKGERTHFEVKQKIQIILSHVEFSWLSDEKNLTFNLDLPSLMDIMETSLT